MRPLPRRYSLLVFDWDGTLADSTTMIAGAIRRACADIGYPEPSLDDARYVIGLGLADALAHVAPALARERHPELAARYRHHHLAGEADIALFPGARELLGDLGSQGYRLAVATGKTRAGLDRALARHALAPAFTATRCADESGPKPQPAMLLHLMQATRTPPASTLMIGDTTHDLDLARNAGVDAVALAQGAHGRAALEGRSPRATLASLAELRAWLAGEG